MNSQYKDSITSKGAGYMKEPANEIGSYEGADSDIGAKNAYSVQNRAYVISDLPTNENSTKRAAPELSAGLDSPANVGDSSC